MDLSILIHRKSEKMTKVELSQRKKLLRNIISIGSAALIVIVLILAVSQKISNSPIFAGKAKIEGLVVFVDAGHGGKNNGATLNNNERLEKDDTLKISLAVQDALNKKGVQVEMSRSTDEFVSLEDRCNMANKSGAQLFVSIHRNSADNGSGVEIWAKSNKPKADTTLANCIMDNLEETDISKSRGVRFGYISNPKTNYFVNNATDMPSCLIELGFITSEKDNSLLDKNLNKYADAIADGIIEAATKLKLKPASESLV